jgi:hypothetical protein
MRHEIDLFAESSCEAISLASTAALKNAHDDGYSRHSVVSADIVRWVDPTVPPLPSPPRAAAKKRRSPPAPKGSTAAKKGSAQKRGGKGQRKA